jgi:threonine efflux protein
VTEGSILLAVYGAFIVGLISPGPDLLLVVALSLKQGKRAAILASLGIAIGVGLWVLAAAAGLGGLIEAAPDVWQGARLLAGGVLIYLGARAISASIRGQRPREQSEPAELEGSPLILGAVTNLANPKAAVVLIGLTAVLSDAVPGRSELTLAVLGMPLLTAAWFTSVSTILSHDRIRVGLASRQRLLDMIVGIALAGVGAILIQAT